MIKKFLALLIIVITFTLGITGHPQERESTHRFQVYVHITAEDASLKSLIESYIKRELRSLQDVDVVYTRDEMPYEIAVVAMELKKVSGHKSGGVAFAVNILYPFDNRAIEWYVRFKQVWDTFVNPLTLGLYRHPDLSVQVGDRANLEGLCQTLVATFDANHLESGRKGRKSGKKAAEEFIRQLKKKK